MPGHYYQVSFTGEYLPREVGNMAVEAPIFSQRCPFEELTLCITPLFVRFDWHKFPWNRAQERYITVDLRFTLTWPPTPAFISPDLSSLIQQDGAYNI